MAFDSSWIGDTLNISPRFARRYSVITSDSRKATTGSLFVALPGDKFDGHDFITAAIQSGAEAILASADKLPPNLPANVEVFAVKDSLAAYRELARAWRLKLSIPFVVVAGSVGKTTTKGLLSAILRGRFRGVASTVGSQNGFVGIPMTLLSIPESADVAVIEVGIDEPGAMAQHLELVLPTHSLLTAIGPEHLEKLLDLGTVAREECLALQVPAKAGATIVMRIDDPWIEKTMAEFPRDAHTWTCSMATEIEGEKALLDKFVRGEYFADRETLKVELPDGSIFELSMPLPGAHNAGNLLVAVTMATALGLSPIEIQRGLAGFGVGESVTRGRSELRVLAGNTPVICDYYNANPTSVEAGLDLLASVATRYHSKKKIAVLGDMLELGTLEEKFHRDLAAKISAVAVDTLFLYGPRMRWLFEELKKTATKLEVGHFTTHEEIADALAKEMRAGDALLIKGSRGMKMETVWERAWKQIEPKLGTGVPA